VPYVASWTILVDGENLDPVEIASRGRELLRDVNKNTWIVKDVDSGELCVVDATAQRVIHPGDPAEPQAPSLKPAKPTGICDDDEPPF
jgi:hypothetical protein